MFEFIYEHSKYLIYLDLVLIGIILNLNLKNKIPPRITKKILDNTFVATMLVFLSGFILPGEILPQAAFTFSSVYFGFWLSEQVRNLEERRKLKFFLGMLWQELRYNRVQLETLKENYKFFMDKEGNLEIMFLKFSGINTHAGFLKSTVHDAFVSSSVITGLKKDDIFNDIATAYTNMKFLQSALSIVFSDFEIKLKTHHYAIATNGSDPYAPQILEDLGEKIRDHAGKELAIAYRSVCIALASVDTYLNTMMIKSDEKLPYDNDLTEEDWKFISEILKKSPGFRD